MPKFSTLIKMITLACGVLTSAQASAHIQLDEPTARYADQKRGPCGLATDPGRGDKITTYEPGATITVKWRETVPHPSHYRISFDADGQDDFKDPNDYMDFNSNPAVLLDAIEDKSGTGAYEVQVTLPDVECDRCTLQLVQVMYDKPPYTVGGNDLYYQCADLTLKRATPAPDMGHDMGSPQDMATPHDMAKAPDLGPFEDDMGAPSPTQDMGRAQEDMSVTTPSTGSKTQGDDGCSSASGGPLGLGQGLLMLLGVGLGYRRRRRK